MLGIKIIIRIRILQLVLSQVLALISLFPLGYNLKSNLGIHSYHPIQQYLDSSNSIKTKIMEYLITPMIRLPMPYSMVFSSNTATNK